MREIDFEKYHGLGNDFLVVASRLRRFAWSRTARAMTDRHSGVGADGLAVVLRAESAKHDARVRFFNADGSEAEMSGNGIRCVAAFLLRRGRGKRPLIIETAAGTKTVRLVKSAKNRWVFRVSMGAPILAPSEIPFHAPEARAPVVGFPLETSGGQVAVSATSLGNPHCSIFVTDFDTIDWEGVGREIETHALFPRRTNVEFVKIVSRGEIEVRFWERGVGKTASSGTGACAASVAAILKGLTERKVRVRTITGILEVEWPQDGEVFLTGPVERVARGTFYYRASPPT